MVIFNENEQLIDLKRDILNEIVQKTVERIETKKRSLPLDVLKNMCEVFSSERTFQLEKTLKSNELSLIFEIKSATPSFGDLDFDFSQILDQYKKADAIGYVSEPFYFKGKDNILQELTEKIPRPIVRFDFIIDEYMIYESKFMNVSAINLICSILDDEQLENYLNIADKLGMSVIFETYTKEEVLRAVNVGARIISVNNRNLRNFATDLRNSLNLRVLVPKNIIFIAQSGIKTKEDINKLKEIDAQAVIIGKAILDGKTSVLDNFRGV